MVERGRYERVALGSKPGQGLIRLCEGKLVWLNGIARVELSNKTVWERKVGGGGGVIKENH